MLCILMQSTQIAMIIFTHTSMSETCKLLLPGRAVLFSLCTYSISHVNAVDTKENFIKGVGFECPHHL